MIGYLSGKILEIEASTLLVDVNGVGYLVYVSDVSKYSAGSDVQIYIHTDVKETDISLFGFENLSQKKIFKMLIGVSGIGAKTALAILAHGSASQVHQAIVQADVDFFKAVSGIGKKTAQRVIIDLKSKVGSVTDLDLSEPEPGNNDVFDALVSMGFDGKQVHKALLDTDPSLSEQEKIKAVIKSLTK